MDEDERRHAPRREAQAGVRGDVGELLRPIRSGVREEPVFRSGAHRPERADGHADLGVVRLYRDRGARLRKRSPRTDAREGRTRAAEAHDLGPQPRNHVSASEGRV